MVVQADAPARMQPEDILKLNVMNGQGQLVPLSAFVDDALDQRPDADHPLQRLPGMRESPATPPGYSTGRRDGRWNVWRRSCRPVSATTGPGRRARKSSRARRPCLYARDPGGVPALAALYESWSIRCR